MKSVLLLSVTCFLLTLPALGQSETRCITAASSAYQASMDQTFVRSAPIDLAPDKGPAFRIAFIYRHRGEDPSAERHYGLMLSATTTRPLFTGTGFHELVMIADGVRTPLGPGTGSPTPTADGNYRETVAWSLDNSVINTLATAKAVSMHFGAMDTVLTPCDLGKIRELSR